MLAGGEIPDLLSCVDVNALHVYASGPAIFVCGGKTDACSVGPTYLSFRDAFLRFAFSPPLDQFEIILAETANIIFPAGHYQDFFRFETDIAQIVELVLLFSESFGSAAELGAFAITDEIAKNLLVVIDDRNYGEISFVALGPLKFLQDRYGSAAICVLNCNQLGITSISRLNTLKLDDFKRIITQAISIRSKQIRNVTTFDKNIRGHLIKLITGLIQFYGSLTLEEILCYVSVVDHRIDEKTLKDFLLCAEFVQWIKSDKRGVELYYSARKLKKQALAYRLQPQFSSIDRIRWQADIRNFWRNNEPDRFEALVAVLGP